MPQARSPWGHLLDTIATSDPWAARLELLAAATLLALHWRACHRRMCRRLQHHQQRTQAQLASVMEHGRRQDRVIIELLAKLSPGEGVGGN